MMLMAVLQSFSMLQGAVFAFMQFPNRSVAGMALVGVPDLTNYSMGDQLETQYSQSSDVHILEKLSCVSSQLNVGEVADKVVSESNCLLSCSILCLEYFIWIWKMELLGNVFFIDCRDPILRC